MRKLETHPRNDDIDGNAPMDLGSPTGNDERHMQMFFLEEDPRTIWSLFKDYAEKSMTQD
ncbi:MAG: hypothetical protein CM15mP49_15420 [Actinomycetota bacterium]|nr:MAG: hypothetical protein CM15mP49_15420 [Actinomycetota bacterium]